MRMDNTPIICKLCGDTLRDGYDGYSDQYAEWGTTDTGLNDSSQRPALYVHCERCLTTNKENDDV